MASVPKVQARFAVAHFVPGGGKPSGTVVFAQRARSRKVLVSIDLKGLRPRAVNAMHVHEHGDTRRGCASLGLHWNPRGTVHGHHAGDLCFNIAADGRGQVYFEYEDNRLGSVEKLYGRSVVIHAGPDDLGLGGDEESLISGNAGHRLACAVIGRTSE